ncbi:hypothetical protein BDQ12DRAFT_572061, partial [Crucibulum laeve]
AFSQSINCSVEMRLDDPVLERLKSGNSTRVMHNECMSDTRVDILKSIYEWVNDLDGPNIFWLHGHPGTGKSTIALTVAKHLRESGQLGSSFFFQRDLASSQSPASLWCSVAYDLAQKHLDIRKNAIKKLRDGEIDPNQTSYMDIFNKLINDPLTTRAESHACQGRHHVVLLDALDECGGLNKHRSYRKDVLNMLGCWPSQFKLLISSRDENDIFSKLNGGQNRCMDLEIGKNVTQQSMQDILAYLRFSFEEIAKPYKSIQCPWPTEVDLQDMTKAAAGLFIWASTVVKLVGDGQPTKTLAVLLNRIRTGQVVSHLVELEMLYLSILESRFRKPEDIEFFRQVSGAIIAARIPLSAEAFAKLLPSLDKEDIEFVCLQLRSVLDAGSDLRFTHQSFVDFLIGSQCPENFHCNRLGLERQLALACFEIMAHELHFNMGNIESSHQRNKDIPDLSQKIEKHVSYSCFYWASHLENLEYKETTRKVVLSFLELKLLSWLEVLSIYNVLERASLSLASLVTWASVRSSAKNDAIKTMAQDCLSFIRAFGVPMSQATPHIYLSGLAFSPQESWIHRHYFDHFPRLLKVNHALEVNWHYLQGIIRGHENLVGSVAFSADGRRIVSGSDDQTIRLWDAETQQPIGEPLCGHENSVRSVAFSADGRHIVSGSYDQTIRLWDAETRKPIGEPLRGHENSNSVNSVSFSADGRHIVSGSDDQTIRLWDAETHQPIGEPLRGHKNWVNSVAFSADGRCIVSGSDDQTLRLSVSFSADGRHIVSGSDDQTIRLWNAETQQPIGEPLCGHEYSVRSVSFSADGRRIVSGSYDQTIRLWDAETQQHIGEPLRAHENWPLRGHNNSVNSVAFSADGRHIVSGSDDQTVRLWDAETQQPIGEPLCGHEYSVRSVAFTADGQRIVSGSDDQTIRLWDAETHQPIGEPLCGHENLVSSVAFSADGRCIVSGSFDQTIRLWDAENHQPISKPLHGHENSV